MSEHVFVSEERDHDALRLTWAVTSGAKRVVIEESELHPGSPLGWLVKGDSLWRKPSEPSLGHRIHRDDLRKGWHVVPEGVRYAAVEGVPEGQRAAGPGLPVGATLVTWDVVRSAWSRELKRRTKEAEAKRQLHCQSVWPDENLAKDVDQVAFDPFAMVWTP